MPQTELSSKNSCARVLAPNVMVFGDEPLGRWWWWWFSPSVMFNSCNSMDRSLTGSSVHGILQARILERVAAPSSRGSSWSMNQTRASCTGRQILYHWTTWVGGEGDNRGWNGWMVSLTQWRWVWSNSRIQWWTRKSDMLQSMGSQRAGHDLVTEQQRTFWLRQFTP